MSPKEKGNWLRNQFYNLKAWEVMEPKERRIEYDIAREAAILCVEQAIIFNPFPTDPDERDIKFHEYWNEVLTNLKNS